MRVRRRPGWLLLAIAAVVSVLVSLAAVSVGGSSSASAASTGSSSTGLSWKVQHPPSQSVKNGGISAVSCASADFCVGVGYVNGSDVNAFPLTEMWDGKTWTVRSTPNDGVPGALSAVSCPSGSFCEAVGYQMGAEGQVPLAESWNGKVWTTQSTPSSSDRSSLTGVSCWTSNACEAVGGQEGSPSNIDVMLAEAWDGSSWSIQTSPDPVGGDVSMQRVSCPGANACEAVGYYYLAGSVGMTMAERWDGSTWTLQSSPNGSGSHNTRLTAVSCPEANTCEAVGYYQDTSGFLQTLAEGWDGSAWTIQPTPTSNGSALSGISCTAQNYCEAAGGYPTTGADEDARPEVWNGASWAIQSLPAPAGAISSPLGAVSCVASYACEFVGYYASAQVSGSNYAEWWNGVTGTFQTTPKPSGPADSYLVGVSCPAASSCEAVGYYDFAQYKYRGMAEKWTGSGWKLQPVPLPAGATLSRLSAVSCSTTTLCEAVGDYTNSTGRDFPLAEIWNGTTWKVQATTDPTGGSPSALQAVSCPTANFCEAVGFKNKGTQTVTLSEIWNGSTWSLQTSPNGSGATQSRLSGISCLSDATCEAVGKFTNSESVSSPLAESWNGTKWAVQSLPTLSGSSISELNAVSCVTGDTCEAVGGRDSGALAEAWTGSKWKLQSPPNPPGTRSRALTGVTCSSATSCEAVGQYNNPDNRQVTLAMSWVGTGWNIQSTPTPAGTTDDVLSGVSSPTGQACEAVGSLKTVAGWTSSFAEVRS